MTTHRRLRMLGLLAGASLPATAWAQSGVPTGGAAPPQAATAPAAEKGEVSGQLDDIVVTARKVSENLTAVPLAITAITAEGLANKGISDLTQVAAFTPGLRFQNQSVGRNDRGFKQYIIRGIVPNSGLATRQTVTVFVDGAPVSGGNVSGVTDIERIEVIKGPQSAFFGRSTFAGAMSVITRAPSYDFQANGSASYSSFGTYDLNASVEGAIIPDKLALRVSGRTYHTDGQYRDYNFPSIRLGRRGTESISIGLLAEPTDNLRIRLFGVRWHDHDGLPANGRFGLASRNCSPSANVLYVCGKLGAPPASSQTWDQNVFPEALNAVTTRYTLYDPNFITHLGLERRAEQYRATATQNIGDFALSAIGSYGRNRWGYIQTTVGVDYRSIPNPNASTRATLPYIYTLIKGNTQDRDAYGELRLNSPANKRLTVSLGANYFWSQTDNLTPFYSITGYLVATPRNFNRSNTVGVFGSAQWEFVDNIFVSVEGRYQADKITQQAQSVTAGVVTPVFSKTFNSFAPRGILRYEPTPNTSIYASYSEGNRPGEFNTTYRAQTADVQAQIRAQADVTEAVPEDKIRMGEVGFKGTLLENRLRVLLSAYYGRWTDRHIQNNVTFTTPDQPNVQRVIQVVGANGITDLKGLELETALKVTPQLTAEGTFNIADTKNKRTFSTDALVLLGNGNPVGTRLPFYPKYSGSASLTYERSLSGTVTGFIRGDALYTGRIYESEANLAYTAPSVIGNARVGVNTGNYKFEIFVTNLTNNATPTSLARAQETIYNPTTGAVTGTGQGITVSLADRRSYGLRVGAKF